MPTTHFSVHPMNNKNRVYYEPVHNKRVNNEPISNKQCNEINGNHVYD